MSIEITYHKLSTEQFHRVTANQTAWDDFRGSGFPGLSREEVFAIVRSPLRV
jgi:hypothetical protein